MNRPDLTFRQSQQKQTRIRRNTLNADLTACSTQPECKSQWSGHPFWYLTGSYFESGAKNPATLTEVRGCSQPLQANYLNQAKKKKILSRIPPNPRMKLVRRPETGPIQELANSQTVPGFRRDEARSFNYNAHKVLVDGISPLL